jgi:alginate O-acetyltransferase complex protein AlgI
MLVWHGGEALTPFGLTLTVRSLVVLAVGLAVITLPRSFVVGDWLQTHRSRWAGALRVLTVVAVFPLVLASVAAGTFSPFLYFQF